MSASESDLSSVVGVSPSAVTFDNGTVSTNLEDLKYLERWLSRHQTTTDNKFLTQLTSSFPHIKDLLQDVEPDIIRSDPLEKGISLTQCIDRIIKSQKTVDRLVLIIKEAVQMDIETGPWGVAYKRGQEKRDDAGKIIRYVQDGDYSPDHDLLEGGRLWKHREAAFRVGACADVLLAYLHLLSRQEPAYPSKDQSQPSKVTTSTITTTPTGTIETVTTVTTDPDPIYTDITWSQYATMIDSLDLSFIQLPYKEGRTDAYYLRSSLTRLLDIKECIPMLGRVVDFLKEDTILNLRAAASPTVEPSRALRVCREETADLLEKISVDIWRVRPIRN